MKNSVVLTMLLSAGFTLSGFAQQSSSSSTSTPTQGPESIREPIPAPTPTDFWDGDEPNLANLVTHPFANKKYVQRLTRPISERLNELDEITTQNKANITDIDSRAQQGLKLASEKTNLADQHATDAANKAQLAQTAATDATTHVSNVEQKVNSLDQYKGTNQTEIRFRPGQSVLSKQAKDALDQVAESVKDQRSYIIEVRGYSSGKGQTAIANSQKMADSVMRYFVLSHNIPVYRIYVLSMGNAPAPDATTAKQASGGRVEVSVLNNDQTTAQR